MFGLVTDNLKFQPFAYKCSKRNFKLFQVVQPNPLLFLSFKKKQYKTTMKLFSKRCNLKPSFITKYKLNYYDIIQL